MWKNTVEGGGIPQMTIWSMRVACWIPNATNTHSQYELLIVFPRQIGFANASDCYLYT